MVQIADALQAPVEWFYQGAGVHMSAPVTVIDDPLSTMGTTNDGIDLAKAFNAIKDVKARRHLVSIADDLARLAG